MVSVLEWYEDESFWKATYPFLFSEARFEAAETHLENILDLVGMDSGAVLDLCCGPGRFAIPLAQRGFRVTAVDRSPFLLDEGRKRAARRNQDIKWIEKDMREFERPEAFDLVLNLNTSFGYFDAKDEDVRVLRKIFTSLKPGGRLVMDLMGKEKLARIFQPTVSEKLEDGTLLVQRHKIFDEWTRIRNEWIIIKGTEVRTFEFHHTIYSGQELKDRLLAVGFGDVKLCGSFEGEEYGRESDRFVAIAAKPALTGA
ncbi:MAG: class I SAM-dependent methyltransferase [Gemmatimonadetes bacterium]|nr:class I SAM-dependent methyltransferase [Gemmatimonadota bacterium]